MKAPEHMDLANSKHLLLMRFGFKACILSLANLLAICQSPVQDGARRAQAGGLPMAAIDLWGWLPGQCAAAALLIPCAPLTMLIVSLLLSATHSMWTSALCSALKAASQHPMGA